MSQSDFKVHLNAIAPAVAELDRPKIEAGQVWRTRSGELATVKSIDNHDDYPVNIKIGSLNICCGRNGRGYGDVGVGADEPNDLVELIQDADGFTIWRGGERPVPGDAVVTARFSDDSNNTRRAAEYAWGDPELIAYKVVEATKSPPGGWTICSVRIADGKVTAETIAERDRRLAKAAQIDIDLGAKGGNRHVVSVEIPPGYNKLFDVLMQAFKQAADGKGKERHARDGVAFEDQPMSQINRQLGSIDGFIYQAHKKSLEAKRLPDGRAQAELLGAVNYLAGAVITLDTWAKKDSSAD